MYKQMGFISRSFMKLSDINDEFKLIKDADRVLDLGCSPGSWIQYIIHKFNDVKIIGIDLLKLHVSLDENVKFIQADIFEISCMRLVYFFGLFDVVLSDILPHSSGVKSLDQRNSHKVCCRVMQIVISTLRLNGNFCVKALFSQDILYLLELYKKFFQSIDIKRVKSTLRGSGEIYIVGISKKNID